MLNHDAFGQRLMRAAVLDLHDFGAIGKAGMFTGKVGDVPRLTLPDVSPRAYRRLTFVALVFLAAIIVTGALVRLTDSGLGCTDWPNCERGTLIRVSNGHQAVEQINRLFTGAMMIAVTVAVLASLRLVPRRRDLTWLSVSLVVGVLGQAVVGGVVVLTHLHPAAVVWHFLLSIAVLTAALVLHRRAREDGPYERTVTPSTLRRSPFEGLICAVASRAGFCRQPGLLPPTPSN